MRASVCVSTLTLVALTAAGCGGDPVAPTSSQPRLARISGNGQEGPAGERLARPLVVQVRDRHGDPAAGVPVSWRVADGAGQLETAGDVADPDRPVARTDDRGFARVWFRPSRHGANSVAASVHGLADSPVTFTLRATLEGAVLTPTSETRREALAGGWSELRARVTNHRTGTPIEGVSVTWTVVAGEGGMDRPRTDTDSEGVAGASFRPSALGSSFVTAAVEELPGSPVTFETEATGVLIWLLPPDFVGPANSSRVIVPVGTPVTWACWCDGWSLEVISGPGGGSTLESGQLGYEDVFEFVPRVTGTWEYRDRASGARGTLTAQ